MTKTRACITLTFGTMLLAVVAVQGADPAGEQVFESASAFEALKALEGDWEGSRADGDSSVAVSYRVTAAGSALIKTYAPGAEHEMVTVFFMDGDDLVLTHYCALGNQPQMKFEASDRPGEIRFAFAGGSNFAPAKDTQSRTQPQAARVAGELAGIIGKSGIHVGDVNLNQNLLSVQLEPGLLRKPDPEREAELRRKLGMI